MEQIDFEIISWKLGSRGRGKNLDTFNYRSVFYIDDKHSLYTFLLLLVKSSNVLLIIFTQILNL